MTLDCTQPTRGSYTMYNIFIHTHIKHVKKIISMLYIYVFAKKIKIKKLKNIPGMYGFCFLLIKTIVVVVNDEIVHEILNIILYKCVKDSRGECLVHGKIPELKYYFFWKKCYIFHENFDLVNQSLTYFQAHT